jgi:hypothetical protein
MNEHSFIRAVHAYLPSEVFRWKIHDTFAGGVPDAFYAGPASTLFVEYKYVKTLPKRNATPIRTGLTSQQAHWLDRLHDFNQPVALIVGCEKLALVILAKQWNTDIAKAEYVERAVPFKTAAQWISDVCTNRLRQKDERQIRTFSSHKPATDLEPPN